jgi:predicted unusual protein kinase regulating ubiquinone biosynthesis (AarF/ABC1/UbiB family)
LSTQRGISASRLGRLQLLGRLAGGVAGGVVSEGLRQLSRGNRPGFADLLLTPANARRLTDRLSEMRGAAMKVGQLVSMDSGQLLPPELSEVLASLRDSAHRMPLGQVAQVLQRAWGEGWEQRFTRFVFTPLAAASIGQVHEAVLRDGRRLAIKIQYPGIRQSIDSDVDNVAGLLRMFNLVPAQLDVAPLLAEAKRQLHAEADYRQEATALERFARRLDGDARFAVPGVVDALTTPEVLSMTYMDGQPIETLSDRPQAERDGAAGNLLELALREVFDWGLVQTDSNFANYRYHAASRRIQLLDFGATRAYSAGQRADLRALLNACVEAPDSDVAAAAVKVGYLGETDPPAYRSSVIALLRTATEPARAPGSYAFAGSDLADRMSRIVVDMRLRSGFGQLPPAGVLFLHRKLAGLYLLLTRLRTTLPVRTLIAPWLNTQDLAPPSAASPILRD